MVRYPLSPFRIEGLRGGFGRDFRGTTGQIPADHAQDAEGRLVPPLDVSETDLALKICAEFPGVTENELDIQSC